jgi:CHAT domain-containing protein/tetratricopeptide (TPR) repeat protein
MVRNMACLAFLVSVLCAPALGDEPDSLSDKPQWQRMLQGDDAKRAAELQTKIDAAETADRYEEAIDLHEEMLALRTQRQGADHWETVSERWTLDGARTVAALPVEQRAAWVKGVQAFVEAQQLDAKGLYLKTDPVKREFCRLCEQVFGDRHPWTATGCNGLAFFLNSQAKYSEAQPLFEKALKVELEVFGERHRRVVVSYLNVASNLSDQAKYAEAQPHFEKALQLGRELLGEEDPVVARCCDNLAGNLLWQGEYGRARTLHEEALARRRRIYGETHRDVAIGYLNLAGTYLEEGKYADAQALFQKALDIFVASVGPKHPYTATAYDNLGAALNLQGRYADAQPLLQASLEIRREFYGEKSEPVARSHQNLATNLSDQGRYSEAQPLYRQSLEVFRDVLGDRHPAVALVLRNVAANLRDQGKYGEAQPLYEEAVDLLRRRFGERNRDVIDTYSHLAATLSDRHRYSEAQTAWSKILELSHEILPRAHPHAAYYQKGMAISLSRQGKHTQAQPFYEEALALRRQTLGEAHQATARSYSDLASNLHAQAKYEEALQLFSQAAASYEAARLNIASRGLDRAPFAEEVSPYRFLAASHARFGDASAAWQAAEADLARGLRDEIALRESFQLTAEEQQRKAAILAELGRIQSGVSGAISKQSPTEADKNQLRKLQASGETIQAELAMLAVAASQRNIASLGELQTTLAPNDALLFTFEVGSGPESIETWACIVRHTGDPIWKRLRGPGLEQTWTDADSKLATKLIAPIVNEAPASEIAQVAARLRAHLLDPFKSQLSGIHRLFVPHAMAGSPLDVLTDEFTICYVPSGTFLARLTQRPRWGSDALLALGDPVFPPLEPTGKRRLPPSGLLITRIVPDGHADHAGLRQDDVLMKYANVELASVEQLLKLVEEHAEDRAVPVTVWRDGETIERELAPAKLGVSLDKRSAPEVVAEKRDRDEMLARLTRGGDLNELPGTAIEVGRLEALVAADDATILTRSAASEQELERLRTSGKLETFRYLHFATHGEPNNARSFESALILSQDQITGEIPRGGGKYYDGRLTANEVLENWKLNADLVTLSACESALGRPGGGDGLLGFAQAFLLAGARSVCLSLWKVDDKATALLMGRFYENLLGKRDGLSQPMPKAEALAEAKRWLRELTQEEVDREWAKMTDGMSQDVVAAIDERRGKAKALKVTTEKPGPQDDHPYSHPRFWAAFILIGDPN